ncbi:MAG: hypothetical protein WC955_03615 [Elusimicrobiota bacterium]
MKKHGGQAIIELLTILPLIVLLAYAGTGFITWITTEVRLILLTRDAGFMIVHGNLEDKELKNFVNNGSAESQVVQLNIARGDGLTAPVEVECSRELLFGAWTQYVPGFAGKWRLNHKFVVYDDTWMIYPCSGYSRS